MSMFDRMRVCEAGAILNPVPGKIGAAYWVESDDTRDYLTADVVRLLTDALGLLGFDVVARSPTSLPPSGDEDAAHV